MNKPQFTNHDDVVAEAKKDWRYRFWWYLLWPKYALIRLWIKAKAKSRRE